MTGDRDGVVFDVILVLWLVAVLVGVGVALGHAMKERELAAGELEGRLFALEHPELADLHTGNQQKADAHA